MAAGFVGEIADQRFAPSLLFGLAGFVGRHGGVAGGSVQKLVGSRGNCDSWVWTAAGFEPLTEARTKCSIVNCAADLQQQVGASPRPPQLLRLVHPAIDHEIRRALRHRSPERMPERYRAA
jgi:hypothetical protein